jgi:hypothetical protein
MIHERFDLDRWKREFPLAKLSEFRFGGTITGPGEMAVIEQIREALIAEGADLGRRIDTDICVWNLGESPQREVTKIGGVPFWPSWEPWPESESGEPCTFVAQFCFADSTDLLPELPGDILVIYSEEDDYSELQYYWLSLEDADDLVDPDSIPSQRWSIQPCYAVLHRTADFPEAKYASLEQYLDQYPYPFGLWSRWMLDATKIGGYWTERGELADPDSVDDPELREDIRRCNERSRQMQDEFICQLGSLSGGKPWPFLNAPTAKDVEERRTGRLLCLWDMGALALFFDGESLDESRSMG